ncbi:MAG TPA: DUF2946 domain-containing protein [Burkholderiales bacterium]|nr:DUF2946 domain-containing protein [Burkholderiales bacterium]
MNFKRLRLFARIALFALLWQALALPLSNAMASTGKPGEVPICTASGIKWIQAGDLPGSEQRQDQRTHCPLCVLTQDTPALVNSRTSIALSFAPARKERAEAPVTPRLKLSAVAPPPARAPPSFS